MKLRLREDEEERNLAILDAPLDKDAVEVPEELWKAYSDADAALYRAQQNILRYVDRHHPDAFRGVIFDWLDR